MNPGYEKYIRSAAWKAKADARLAMDRHACQVCGRDAEEVHHLSYEHFGNERMDELASLCRRCHRKAEELYDPAKTPWIRLDSAGNGNFMAAMRSDAQTIAPEVLGYISEARGMSFDSLMALRESDEDRKYWTALRKAVNALCLKRYSMQCMQDRRAIAIEAVGNHVQAICLSAIEHWIRNSVQRELHEIVMAEHLILDRWSDVASRLGITDATLRRLRHDDGGSAGPTLREAVMYCCALDAAAGIPPMAGFSCLDEQDYLKLNQMASSMGGSNG